MSYEIIYQYRASKTDAQTAGDDEARYIVAVEMGSNNCYDHNGKRSRSWQLMAVGTQTEVLRQVVRLASSCEGGMLKPRGRDCTPEQFIGKIRLLIQRACVDAGLGGRWAPMVRLADEQEAESAKTLGAVVEEDTYCGQHRLRADFTSCLPGYFRFVTAVHRNAYGWRLGTVHGLPAS